MNIIMLILELVKIAILLYIVFGLFQVGKNQVKTVKIFTAYFKELLQNRDDRELESSLIAEMLKDTGIMEGVLDESQEG